MASFTLGTASQATGMAKSSILRAIKRGVLSATRNEDGSWAIDPAELNRCFPLLSVHGAPPSEPEIKQDAMADVLVAELRATIADLRSDRDRWRDAHERSQAAQATLAEALAASQRLLSPPAATPDVTPAEQEATQDSMPVEQGAMPVEQPRRRWWQMVG